MTKGSKLRKTCMVVVLGSQSSIVSNKINIA